MSQCNANKYSTLKNTQHLEPGICLDMAFGSPKDQVCVFWGVPMTDCNVWDHPTPSRTAPPKLSLGLLWITSVLAETCWHPRSQGAGPRNERQKHTQATVVRNTGGQL